MNYAKMYVKTAAGWKVKYVAYEEIWKFGRYLSRYYKDTEKEYVELPESAAEILKKIGIKFKLIV